MPAFAVMVDTHEAVGAWIEMVDARLRGVSVVNLFFRGGMRKLRPGTYAVDIEPVFPRLVLQAFGVFLVVPGFLMWWGGLPTVGMLAIIAGILILWLAGAIHRPLLYRMVIALQCWRITQDWRMPEDVTMDLVRERVYGTD